MLHLSKSLRSPEHIALIGELKSARQRAGMSQQDVADRLGVPQSFVAKIELGERRIDVIEFLWISKALDVSWKDVLQKVQRQGQI